MTPNKILILSAKEVAICLDMPSAIEAMKGAFTQLSSHEAQVPLRTQMPIPESRGTALFMPVYLPQNRHIGLKTVTVFENNPQKNLPLIHAMMQILDAETGKPLAIMDGEILTAIRTGAGSGLATDLLAHKDAHTVTIIGAGIQGRTQLEAVCAVRPIKTAHVISRSSQNAQIFAKEMAKKLSIEVSVTDPATALATSQVICTATTSLTPVFEDAMITPGTHINGVGSYRPDMCEVPSETVKRARVFVDQKAGCCAEAGDLIQPITAGIITKDHIIAELGELVPGKKPGRLTPNDITFFKSVGNAVQDLAVATLILEKAKAMGLGTTVAL
ncbi:MAG: hypothetical protein QM498_10740 [Desulfobacterium sp.]